MESKYSMEKRQLGPSANGTFGKLGPSGNWDLQVNGTFGQLGLLVNWR